MELSEYASYDGLGLAELIKSGSVLPREVAEAATRAIEELNGKLNFMAHLTPENTESVLANVNSHSADFCGVPFLIKEGHAMKNQPWNMASRLGVGRFAEEDEEIVKRFRQAGVTILGLSTAPEWGNAPTTESVLRGPTRNPWNLDYMPGGSSGGAAAAVAAGVVPVAHAGDGGGSIRIPAACCGLVGLKPTRARTPGFQGGMYSLTVSHIVSRTVRDSAAMLNSTHGPEAGAIYYALPPQRPFLEEVTQKPNPLRIAFSTKSSSGATIHSECIKAVEDAAKLCESLGHSVEETPLPYDWEPLCNAFTDLWSYKHPYGVEQVEKATGLKSGPDTR